MLPKVSIGLRSYNQKEFLRESIESVLIQDYENMEIVVGDDASTDGTQDMLRDYEKKHPGLFKLIFNEKNLGNPGNGNVILTQCTGKYIAWLDGDDLFLPGKIKKQAEFMENHPDCVICYSNAEHFYESNAKKSVNIYGDGANELIPREGGVEILFKQEFYVLPSAAMTKRDGTAKWDTRMRRASDVLFMIETALNGKIYYLPEVLTRYRRHEGNITNFSSQEDCRVLLFLIYAILDAKYPHLATHTRKVRDLSKKLYRRAVQKVREKQGKLARELLWESLRQGWVSWKWFGWYLRSYLG